MVLIICAVPCCAELFRTVPSSCKRGIRKKITSEFHEWYTDAVRISNEVGCEISVPRVAGRQTYKANSVMQGGITEDYYRMNVAVPFIDHLLKNFEPENRVGKDIFTLVPAAIIKENNLSDLASSLQFWEIDIPSPSSLLSELKLWKRFCEQYHEKTKKMCLPENIANCLKEADRDVYL